MAVGGVPLLTLAALRVAGHRRSAAFWWLAAAFGVSLAADLLTLLWPHQLIHQTYPVLQAGLFALALLPRRAVSWVMVAVLAAASTSIMARGADGLDILLRVVAWGSVAGIGWFAKDAALRASLLIAFGVGLLGWLAYVYAPGWWTWGFLQTCRVVGTGWFVVAVVRAK